jgi:hypothetical protein
MSFFQVAAFSNKAKEKIAPIYGRSIYFEAR